MAVIGAMQVGKADTEWLAASAAYGMSFMYAHQAYFYHAEQEPRKAKRQGIFMLLWFALATARLVLL